MVSVRGDIHLQRLAAVPTVLYASLMFSVYTGRMGTPVRRATFANPVLVQRIGWGYVINVLGEELMLPFVPEHL